MLKDPQVSHRDVTWYTIWCVLCSTHLAIHQQAFLYMWGLGHKQRFQETPPSQLFCEPFSIVRRPVTLVSFRRQTLSSTLPNIQIEINQQSLHQLEDLRSRDRDREGVDHRDFGSLDLSVASAVSSTFETSEASGSFESFSFWAQVLRKPAKISCIADGPWPHQKGSNKNL